MFLPTGPEDFELDELGQPSAPDHAIQWVGKPGVKGPKWARLPLLTVGMLGIQVRSSSASRLRAGRIIPAFLESLR